MADEEEQDVDVEEASGEDGESPPSGGSRKKLFAIAGVAVLLILGGLGAAYFTGLLEPLMAEKVASGQDDPDGNAAKPGNMVFFEVPEQLVNLSSQARKTSYLKIRVSLELNGPEDVKTVEAVMPRIIDNFQVYLRELRLEDLKGSAGMYRLREELLTRVNAAVAPARVNDVLFKEMLVQ
jgi:flagellar FliL protein